MGVRTPPNFLGLSKLPGRRSCGAAVLGPRSSFFEALLEASTQVELYDDEVDFDPGRRGILTERHSAGGVSSRAADLSRRGTFVIMAGFPLETVLGGEGNPPLAVFSPGRFSRREKDLLLQGNHPVLFVGRRAARSVLEKKTSSREDFPARSVAAGRRPRLLRRGFPEPPLIIVDPLVLDPSLLAVPDNLEPGGMLWYQTMGLLRALCSCGTPAGAALLPCRLPRRDPGPAFVLARLVAGLVAYAR